MAHRTDASALDDGPVGLDGRARPSSPRARIVKGLRQSIPLSSLERRIIFFNMIGLAVLVAGITYLTNNKRSLIDLYVEALRKQGEIIAIGIAETAATDFRGQPTYDPIKSSLTLARLGQPTGVRIRLYDRGLRLTADTSSLSATGIPIESRPLGPPPGKTSQSILGSAIETFLSRVDAFVEPDYETYIEVPTAGISQDEEVLRAAQGQIAHAVRKNSEGEIIVSLAMPVTRLKAILGVLQLSTAGGEIDAVADQERAAVLQIFVLAAMASILVSVLLAQIIAQPIRELARAALGSSGTQSRVLGPDRPAIPDMTARMDEIGDLSGALIRMTNALSHRIDAIESFAADVAHEIKNPLTSLRSAVETMEYARTPEQQRRLLDVIESDVKRLDRLVTDISNASRLDAELVRERMETVSLTALVHTLVDMFEAQAAERNVSIRAILSEQPVTVLGLESRLAQVITNVIANAMSFSPDHSQIIVRLRREPDGPVRVSVEDEGPGIPPENLTSIFERFYTERPDGEAFGTHSGLGLSISRQIIEAHGGRIWAENVFEDRDQRKGARFVIELPA